MKYTDRPSEPAPPVENGLAIQLRTVLHYRLLLMNEEAIEDIQGGIER